MGRADVEHRRNGLAAAVDRLGRVGLFLLACAAVVAGSGCGGSSASPTHSDTQSGAPTPLSRLALSSADLTAALPPSEFPTAFEVESAGPIPLADAVKSATPQVARLLQCCMVEGFERSFRYNPDLVQDTPGRRCRGSDHAASRGVSEEDDLRLVPCDYPCSARADDHLSRVLPRASVRPSATTVEGRVRICDSLIV